MDSTTAPRLSASSLSSDPRIDGSVLQLATLLLQPEQRDAGAAALATRLGGKALLIFVRDPEIGALLPAPGFPQTLADSRAWRSFLASCTKTGKHTGALRIGGDTDLLPSVGLAADEDAVLVLIGTTAVSNELAGLYLLLPLLAATLRSEYLAATAAAQGRMARDAAEQATAVTRTLDAARRALQEALQHAEVSRVENAAANDQLRAQADELGTANNSLQDQAAELEVQTEELQTATEDLVQQARAREALARALSAREARYRALVEATAQIVWVTNSSGEFVTEQPDWAAFTGQTFEEYQGMGWLDAIHPDDHAQTSAAWRHAVTTGTVCQVEYRIRRHDGIYRIFSVRAAPVFDEIGELREWVGSETDITEQRGAEQALVDQERQFRTLAESIPQLAWMAEPDGYIFWYNQRWYDYTGTTPEQMAGWGWQSVHDPAELPRVLDRWRASIRTGSSFELEFPLQGVDGRFRWFLTRSVPIKDADGHVVRWFGTNTNIDEQAALARTLQERARLAVFTAEVGTALTQSETLPEMLSRCCDAMVEHLDAAFARIWTLNPATNVLELQASAGLYTHLDGAHSRVPVGQFKIGLIAEERRPHLTNDVIHDPRISDPAWAEREGMVAFAGFPLLVGNQVDGVMALFARHPLTEPTLEAMAAVAHGIALGIERRRAEAERQQFVSLVENSADFIGMATLDGRVLYVNAAGRALVGLLDAAPVTETTIPDFVTPASWPRLRDEALPEVLARGSWRGEVEFRHFATGDSLAMDQTIFLVRDQLSGAPLCIATVARDLRERLRTERQLRDAQRLQSVATLAGGVAHEVNNQMTAVLGFGGFALRALEAGNAPGDDVREMVKAAERAAKVTQQLLTFSRQQVTQPRLIDLAPLVEALRPTLGQLLGADKSLIVSPSRARRLVHVDPTQMEQVLINLTANARDAMPTGGRLIITLEDAWLDRSYAEAHSGIRLDPGDYVLLAVSDTGIGMDRETLAQIFDPFFTTKPVGQGTGLGLSMVYGIVKQHGGFVWAYSEPALGTTVKVYLPAAAAAGPLDSAPTNVATAPYAPPARARPLILVVEDEPTVRLLVRRALESAGYAVIEAANGREALNLVTGLSELPALLITDVVMPELTGRELSDALKRAGAQLPVLYISGYTGDDIVLRGLIPEGAVFLQKPFAPDSLVRHVTEQLARSHPRG